MSFEPRALLVIGAFLCWTLAAAIEFQAIRPDAHRRLPGAWAIGLLMHGLGLILISQRGLIPDVWSLALGNMLLLAAPLFYFSALQRLRGIKPNLWVIAAVPVSVGVLLAAADFGPQPFAARVMVFTAAAVFVLGLICWSAAQAARAGYRTGGWLILGPNLVLATLTVFRAVSVASGEVSGIFGSQGIQVAFYLVNDVCIALAAFGYMDIARTRTLREMQGSSAQSPDAQTGLYSREAFLRSGREEMQRARRREYAVTLMLIQIDRLDSSAADLVLKRVGATIQRDIRMYDVAGRLEGNLMGVVMPELGLGDAVAVAERIRATVAEDPTFQNGIRPVTVSAGVCQAASQEQDLDAVMAAAAACLERARLQGGNCVVTPDTPALKSFIQDTI
jgi:diguanylate cyclase (GGDEF)-like protein